MTQISSRTFKPLWKRLTLPLPRNHRQISWETFCILSKKIDSYIELVMFKMVYLFYFDTFLPENVKAFADMQTSTLKSIKFYETFKVSKPCYIMFFF